MAPKFIGLNPGMMANLWSAKPQDLKHSVLINCWSKGVFENLAPEIEATAYAMMKGVMTEGLLKHYWGGSEDSKEARELKGKVSKIIKHFTPWWAKRFQEFMESLNESQRKVIKLEYFYKAEEKPSQKELAKKAKMSEDNYKYHLKQALKVLEKAYPEYERQSRRNEVTHLNLEREKRRKPQPLYNIEKNGEKTKIAFPKKRSLDLTPAEKEEIRLQLSLSLRGKTKNINKTDNSSKEKFFELNYFDRVKNFE